MNRFLAQRHGVYGQEILETAQIDSFYESVREVRSTYLQSKSGNNRLQWLDSELPLWCQRLEQSLPSTMLHPTEPWLIGQHASLADIALYSLLGTSTGITTGSLVSGFDDFDPKEAYHTTCPRLKDAIQALADNENVQWWERTRPDTFS